MKGKLTTYASDVALIILGLGCFNGVQYGSLITIVTILLAVLDIMFPRQVKELCSALEHTSEDDEDESEAEEEY